MAEDIIASDGWPEYAKIFAALIRGQMDLKADRVFLYNQKWNIPPDDGVFVNVGIIGDRPFGVSQHFEDDEATGGLTEVQGTNIQEIYSVLIYSQNSEARRRRHEILFALNGVPAQQAQEKYSFKISNLPTDLLDVSQGEGSSRLNRYNLTFRVLVSYSRRRSVEFFDNFAGSPAVIVNP